MSGDDDPIDDDLPVQEEPSPDEVWTVEGGLKAMVLPGESAYMLLRRMGVPSNGTTVARLYENNGGKHKLEAGETVFYPR